MAKTDDMEMASVKRAPDTSGSDSSDKGKSDSDKTKDKDKKSSEKSSRSDSDKKKSESKDSDKDESFNKDSDESSEESRKKAQAGESKDDEAESDDDGADNSKKKPGKKKGKKGLKEKLKHQAKAQAAGIAAKGAAKYAMMQFMTKLLEMLSQMVQAAIMAVANAISAIVATVVQVATAIASALAISVAVATFGIVGVIVGVVVIVGVAVYDGVTSSNIAERDAGNTECYVNTKIYTNGNVINAAEEEINNAQLVYSVMYTYGMSDEQIAGMLGNLHCEGSIDPTAIEGIYNEKYTIAGARKQDAITRGFADYTVNVLGYTSSGYKAADDNYYCGIGLMQFTADNNLALRNYADSNSLNWWSMDAQLGFMLAHYKFNDTWVTAGGVDNASDEFCDQYERPASPNYQDRRDSAAGWYVLMNEWIADADYGNSIISMANATIMDGTSSAGAAALDECHQEVAYNNSSIAAAALSLAWKNGKDEAHGNNGTSLYQYVNDQIFGDHRYQECARLVATAVMWSGADDSYSISGCSNQLTHLVSSANWTEISYTSEADKDNLQPGDIFICTTDGVSHTFIYCGTNMVQSYLNDKTETRNIVQASYVYDDHDGNNCPDADSPYIGYNELNNFSYRVFRCVRKTGSLYKNVAVGYTESD